MAPLGRTAAELAATMPVAAYSMSKPAERSGVLFARLQHTPGKHHFEAAVCPNTDILSLHLSEVQGSTWHGNKLYHDGIVSSQTVSLVKAGVEARVALRNYIDVLHVFIPQATLCSLAAEMVGRPTEPHIDGWSSDPILMRLILNAYGASHSDDLVGGMEAEATSIILLQYLLTEYGGRQCGLAGWKRGGLSPRQLASVLDYIEDNVARDLHLDELARLVHLSKFHFLRAFQSETGLTPQRWILLRRVARAKALLARGKLDLPQIALAVGYSSQSSLTTAFKRVVGAPPAAWREQAL